MRHLYVVEVRAGFLGRWLIIFGKMNSGERRTKNAQGGEEAGGGGAELPVTSFGPGDIVQIISASANATAASSLSFSSSSVGSASSSSQLSRDGSVRVALFGVLPRIRFRLRWMNMTLMTRWWSPSLCTCSPMMCTSFSFLLFVVRISDWFFFCFVLLSLPLSSRGCPSLCSCCSVRVVVFALCYC